MKKKSRVTKANAHAVLIYFPKEMMPFIDSAVANDDTDRSKFIRRAVREKLGIASAAAFTV